MIDDKRLDEFIRFWTEAYGEELSREEAAIQANRLLELYRVLARPLPNEEKPD